jgi:hypothetical protein
MRLDAVYLLGGRPSPTPSRRAFLLAGGSFFLGGACGYALGAKPTDEAAAGPSQEGPPKSSGDSELDEWRRLATVAPIEELLAVAPAYVNMLPLTYPRDQVAWSGLERLSQALVDGRLLENRRPIALFVAQIIEKAHPSVVRQLGHWPEQLRRIR